MVKLLGKLQGGSKCMNYNVKFFGQIAGETETCIKWNFQMLSMGYGNKVSYANCREQDRYWYFPWRNMVNFNCEVRSYGTSYCNLLGRGKFVIIQGNYIMEVFGGQWNKLTEMLGYANSGFYLSDFQVIKCAFKRYWIKLWRIFKEMHFVKT